MRFIYLGSTNGLSTYGLWYGTYAQHALSTEWFLSSVSTTLSKAETNVQWLLWTANDANASNAKMSTISTIPKTNTFPAQTIPQISQSELELVRDKQLQITAIYSLINFIHKFFNSIIIIN